MSGGERQKRPMTPAERQKLRRERSAADKGVITPEVHMPSFTQMLVEENLLDEKDIDDRRAVSKAAERVLRLLPKLLRVTRDLI